MYKKSDFLTINARMALYLKYNGGEGRAIADSKIRTKRFLKEAGVGVPRMIKIFSRTESLEKFRWERLTGNFVIKPVSGFGGEGILVIRKRGKWAGEWVDMTGNIYSTAQLKMHCQEILEGRFSMHKRPDRVLLEERIRIHPKFLRFARVGTPDVRVIVYNGVPVMAMLRIPTEESGGKSNLQQGAMGLGIDMASGITTYGVIGKSKYIKKLMDHRKKKLIKVNGIKIPFWKKILETAVESQKAIPELGFMGVDVVLDKEMGPMVLEINARPGLSIQICNKAGLRKRLERVADLKVRSTEHAINIAQSLFGEGFVDRVKEEDGKAVVLNALETIKIKGKGKQREMVRAKVDTGAYRSSIDESLAKKMGLLEGDNVLYYRHYRSSLGREKRRPVIAIRYWMRGKKVTSLANVANRSRMRAKFLVGRRDLEGFLVKT
jgi:alpha-L-glutamate ligase-like protein